MTPRKAHADIVVERLDLIIPAKRRQIRIDLYRALAQLGRVDSVVGYVKDPPDGPHRDSGYHLNVVDFDRYAVVRIVGMVSPRGIS